MNIGALVPNEKVKLAYKCGRDSVICTSKRMLYVDCQGISGIYHLSLYGSFVELTNNEKYISRKENSILEHEIQLYQSL